MNRISRQKIDKANEELNNIINKVELIDAHRILHPGIVEHIFF